jgi:hypothetical protein
MTPSPWLPPGVRWAALGDPLVQSVPNPIPARQHQLVAVGVFVVEGCGKYAVYL